MFFSAKSSAGKPAQRVKPPSRLVTALVLLALIAILIPVGGFVAVVTAGPLQQDKNLVITRGMGVRDIAQSLSDNGAIYTPLPFRVAAKLVANNALKAGEYHIAPRMSMADIILMMHDGRSVVHWFTVAEGLTSAEVAQILRDTAILSGDLPSIPAEGSLLPETYRYSYGDSRAGLVARMQKAMLEALPPIWEGRDPNLPLKSPAEAVILASLVAKETGKPAERPRIAGVFYNRLHLTMRLQSDPTVIYALSGGKGVLDHELGHEDLSFASPYNTYAVDGLPAGPICNPGRAALLAAVHPEVNDFLYFVADGTGGHVFARNLNEHNQNVTRWNQLRAKKP